jgi:hypothetical protein
MNVPIGRTMPVEAQNQLVSHSPPCRRGRFIEALATVRTGAPDQNDQQFEGSKDFQTMKKLS